MAPGSTTITYTVHRSMNEAVFADTSYFIALVSNDDEAHALAVDHAQRFDGMIVTTEWVLAELAGYLAGPRGRRVYGGLVADLRANANFVSVHATHELFSAGERLYLDRPDKSWSLIDCTSFVVMNERRLVKALTTDHHFERAGFTAVLKSGRPR